jgi:hypothetical protein
MTYVYEQTMCSDFNVSSMSTKIRLQVETYVWNEVDKNIRNKTGEYPSSVLRALKRQIMERIQ